MRWLSRMAMVLLGSTLLSGCGAAFELPQGPDANKHLVARILVDLPPELRPAAQLAIDDINRLHPSEFEQTTVVAVYADDTFEGQIDTGTAKTHLHDRLDDGTILGMVGPYNLQLARALLPIANQADLPVFSPTLTDECLTQQESFCTRGEPNSLRPHNARAGQPGDLTFFRVPPVQGRQAKAAADYASGALAKSNAFLVVDNTPVATRMADDFTAQWQLQGDTIAGRASVDTAASPDLNLLAGQIQAAKPDVVYLATTDEPAVAHLGGLLSGHGSLPLIVPDALHTTQMAEAAQSWTGAQLLVTSLSGDPSLVSAEFEHEWAGLHRGDAPPYALETWLATNALIQAIRTGSQVLVEQQVTAIPSRDVVDAAVPTIQVPTDDLNGLHFDSHGDNGSQIVTIFTASKGRWTSPAEQQAA